MPVHTYHLFSVQGAGYEPFLAGNLACHRGPLLSIKMIRDWASIEGGAKVGKFTPPDYGPFGCGPEQLHST